MKDISGIYKITNLINGKVYVGQSCRIYERWMHHRSDLRHDSAANGHLQQAWNKYGEDNFAFEVVEECDIAMLDQREIFWINKLDSRISGYNMTDGGGGIRGYKMPSEAVQKTRAANTGRVRSEETIQRNRVATKKWYETHISASSIEVVCINTGEHFDNAVIAGEKYGICDGNIRRCCNGELRSAGKYKDERLVWIDASNYVALSDTEIQRLIDVANHPVSHPVCLNTGEVFETASAAASKYNVSAKATGETFDCITDAAEQTNTNINSLIACCKGRNKTAGGRVWRYLAA